jgi:hypothetical protein
MSRLLVVASLALALCCALGSAASAAGTKALQHVTIFGDSVAATFTWDPTARTVLAQGDHVTFDLSPCGRLTQPGCITPPPPSVFRKVELLGHRIGPTVVVLVGYNDDPHVYRAGIDKVLRAMQRRGVTHVVWLTLRAINKQYLLINQVIHGASARWRGLMTVLDWNSYSRNRPTWFATDHIHLSALGGVQLATYIHRTLKQMGLTGPPPPA